MAKNKLIPVKAEGNIRIHSHLADFAGCGYIRTIIPAILCGQLNYKRLQPFVTYNIYGVSDPGFYNGMHFCKFQRSATENHLNQVLYIKDVCRKTGTKLIYEVDDLITDEVPESNHAHEYYKHNWPFIQRMLSNVDGITCSTDSLANVLRKHNENVTVIPNHLPKFNWEEAEFRNNENKKPRILYPGSSNHFNYGKSGGDFSPKLLDFIIKTTDKYDWVFVGGYPFELKDKLGKDVEYHPWQTIFNLPSFLRNLKCDIGIAPLEDNLFNRCKSNIKMLEYTALGIPGVYSNVTPYRQAQLTCDNPDDMIYNIEELAKDPIYRNVTWKLDKLKVEKQLYWEDNDNILKYINSHMKLVGKEIV